MVRELRSARAMVPGEHIGELALRWEKARRAALREVLAESPGPDAGDDEAALRDRALARDAAETFRRIFDNSLRLGQSFARYHRHQLSLDEVAHRLGGLGVACLRGRVRPAGGEAALYLERAGCGAPARAGTCDYWREAADGLLLGLSGGLRHARHLSQGHGDATCLDLVYADPRSPLRHGLLSDEVRAEEAQVRRRVQSLERAADVSFLGVSEGVLLYELKAPGCGASPILKDLVERAVRRRFPTLSTRELSPRAVLDP